MYYICHDIFSSIVEVAVKCVQMRTHVYIIIMCSRYMCLRVRIKPTSHLLHNVYIFSAKIRKAFAC